MQFRRLGRTGLDVSTISLGSGGPSRLGQRRGASQAEIKDLVHLALELGVNLIDTAPLYADSESLLGRALAGLERSRYLLGSKFHTGYEGPMPSPGVLVDSIETSLRRLGTDHLDVLFLHSITPQRYGPAIEALLPTLKDAQDRGLVRHLGITESPPTDPDHQMLSKAVSDGHFDVIMVAYNVLNQSAERSLFGAAAAADIGVVAMTAVRRALADQSLLEERLAGAVDRGLIPPDALPADDPLGWLVGGEVASVTDAAYKFAAAPAEVATVLTGTADPDHLRANVAAVLGPPLPDADATRLRSVFGHLAEPLAE